MSSDGSLELARQKDAGDAAEVGQGALPRSSCDAVSCESNRADAATWKGKGKVKRKVKRTSRTQGEGTGWAAPNAGKVQQDINILHDRQSSKWKHSDTEEDASLSDGEKVAAVDQRAGDTKNLASLKETYPYLKGVDEGAEDGQRILAPHPDGAPFDEWNRKYPAELKGKGKLKRKKLKRNDAEIGGMATPVQTNTFDYNEHLRSLERQQREEEAEQRDREEQKRLVDGTFTDHNFMRQQALMAHFDAEDRKKWQPLSTTAMPKVVEFSYESIHNDIEEIVEVWWQSLEGKHFLEPPPSRVSPSKISGGKLPSSCLHELCIKYGFAHGNFTMICTKKHSPSRKGEHSLILVSDIIAKAFAKFDQGTLRTTLPPSSSSSSSSSVPTHQKRKIKDTKLKHAKGRIQRHEVKHAKRRIPRIKSEVSLHIT